MEAFAANAYPLRFLRDAVKERKKEKKRSRGILERVCMHAQACLLFFLYILWQKWILVYLFHSKNASGFQNILTYKKSLAYYFGCSTNNIAFI
jgi:hypothetical protein